MGQYRNGATVAGGSVQYGHKSCQWVSIEMVHCSTVWSQELSVGQYRNGATVAGGSVH